jgi:hypothetical protein
MRAVLITSARTIDAAANAIAGDPKASNYAIAQKIGVSEPTVRRARQPRQNDAAEKDDEDQPFAGKSSGALNVTAFSVDDPIRSGFVAQLRGPRSKCARLTTDRQISLSTTIKRLQSKK